MVLIPLLQVICTAVVLVYAEPEGKALIVFSYRLERFVFQFFSNFLVDSYQRNIKTFLGFSLISRRGVIANRWISNSSQTNCRFIAGFNPKHSVAFPNT